MKSEDILRRTQELLSKKAMEKDAEKTQLERDKAMLIKEVARDLSVTLRPVLEDLAQAQQITIESMRKLLSEIKVEVPRTEVVMPDIQIPRPVVNVQAPEVRMPELNIPAPVVNFPDRMSVTMDAVDNKRPLPVMMMGTDGKPMPFSMGAGGGGKADFFNIKDIKTSTGASWFNDEGLRVSGSFSVTASNSSTQAIDSSGDAYTVANPFPVQVVSGGTATSGVNIVDSSGVGYSGSNPLSVKNLDSSFFLARIQGISADGSSPSQPVTVSSLDATTNTHNAMPGGPGESNRNALRVLMASDAIASVNVTGATGTLASNIVDSSGVAYSGSNPVPVVITSGGTATTAVYNLNAEGLYRDTFPVQGTVTVSSVTASTGVTVLNGEGIARDTWGASQVGTWNINTVASITASTGVSLLGSDGLAFGTSKPVPVTMVTGVSTSIVANLHDSSGVGYSGSNPVPVMLVANMASSTAVTGPVVADAADDGSAPVQFGGIARTANPTAVAANDVVKATFDDVGRQLVRPVQVRDLVVTAYTSLTNGTETTLLSASAGFYHDLIYIMGANASDVAVAVDIRPVTAGNVIMTLVIPASGTAGVSLPVPVPQTGSDGTGNNWTADMGDITGTTVYLSALFSKEV